MAVERIIVDTDIGDDIDDALALAFALGSPELGLVGVTTVYGNTVARARIAAGVLAAAAAPGIPVFAGCGQPLAGSDCEQAPPEEDALPCQYAPELESLSFESRHAVDFIIDTVEASPQAITLVAIGPLTNIAAAIRRKPSIVGKLKRIVLMGGAYYFHFNEWNIRCDPEAASLVFGSGAAVRAVGLDVTKRCILDPLQLERLFSGGRDTELLRLLRRLIRDWQRSTGRSRPILHDALAVAAVFEQGLLEYRREAVQVELNGEWTRGMTFNRTDRDREEQLVERAERLAESSNVEVARCVNRDEFVEMFLDRLLREAERDERSE